MILWDREMKRVKARARLRALPPATRVLWATDALDHAPVALLPRRAGVRDHCPSIPAISGQPYMST